MKTLENFLGEALEISELSNNFRIVTLLKHDGLDLINMTEDEFVKLMGEDLKEAFRVYEHARTPERAIHKAKAIEREMEYAKIYAEHKWKTQKKRDEYMAEFKVNIEKRYADYGKTSSMSFNFKPEVGDCIPTVCILDQNSDERQLRRCFGELTKGRWWKKGTGWAFKYEAGKNDLAYHCNPWIELIMNESDTAQRRKEQERLNVGIAAYYDSVGSGGYTGD